MYKAKNPRSVHSWRPDPGEDVCRECGARRQTLCISGREIRSEGGPPIHVYLVNGEWVLHEPRCDQQGILF